MPTITVDKKNFFRDIGREFTNEEFFAFCFQYGIELDEDTEQTDPNTLPYQLKIEVAANRYDLLCHEGLVRAINIYLGTIKAPNYRLAPWDEKTGYRINILPETKQVRQYAAGAILRGVKFTKERYESFIDLQDKLHMNIARKRKLVAIGTHDLSRIAPGPITYEALAPEKIEFIPLNQTKCMTTKEMMNFYANDPHLKNYLPYVKDSPVHPIFYDSARTVLSFPPIINGDHTKISLDTKDVLVEVTGLDEQRLNIVLNIIVTMFGEYTSEPFLVEPVLVTDADGNERLTPNLSSRQMHIDPAYVNSFLGLSLSPQQICDLLIKMGHDAVPEANVSAAVPAAASSSLPASTVDVASSMLPIKVNVPATRPDILHPVDLVEDAAVAYDYNRLEKTFPKANTIGGPLKINVLADIVRKECAMSGWVECIAWLLCSRAENFDYLNRKDDGTTAVILEKPKTAEYEMVRTSLLPGMLKCVRENRKHSLPLKLFEVGDVVWKDEKNERKAASGRRVGAIFCDRKSGFEVVHGLLDRIMKILDVNLLEEKEASILTGPGYYIKPVNDDTYFPGRSANIYYRPKDVSDSSKDSVIGQLGILHPTVLRKFDLDFPSSVLEFDLWPIL